MVFVFCFVAIKWYLIWSVRSTKQGLRRKMHCRRLPTARVIRSWWICNWRRRHRTYAIIVFLHVFLCFRFLARAKKSIVFCFAQRIVENITYLAIFTNEWISWKNQKKSGSTKNVEYEDASPTCGGLYEVREKKWKYSAPFQSLQMIIITRQWQNRVEAKRKRGEYANVY